MAKQNSWSDRVLLRKTINQARKRLRKVPLEKISQAQFRRIFLKFERNGKKSRANALFVAVVSGLNKSKAVDAQ
jgi:hypothetical protein